MSSKIPSSSSKTLRRLEARYAGLKRALIPIGYILPGTVIKRWMPCGKPSCRCASGPRHHHGPYYQWSLALRGKPITRRLAVEHAKSYQEWTENNRKVRRILSKMRQTSMQAAKHHTPAPVVDKRPQK